MTLSRRALLLGSVALAAAPYACVASPPDTSITGGPVSMEVGQWNNVLFKEEYVVIDPALLKQIQDVWWRGRLVLPNAAGVYEL